MLAKEKIRYTITLALSVLPGLGWVLFGIWTRNSFRLEDFSRSQEILCMALTVVPVLWWLGLSLLGRTKGLGLSGVLITLAACGWILLLCSQWDSWSRAVAAQTIGPVLRDRLRATALVCAGVSLLPLLKALMELPGKGDRP